MTALPALALLLVAAACGAPDGAPEPWEVHARRGDAAQRDGRLDEAAAAYTAALEQLTATDSPPLLRAEAREGLGRTRILEGDLDAAASEYTAVLATLVDTVGLEQVPGPQLAAVLGTLADLHQSLGHTDRARVFYERIGEMVEAGWIDLRSTDLALAYTLAGLARLRRAAGDSTGADSLAGRAVGINLLSHGYDQYIAGRLEEARTQLEQALQAQERFVGPAHPDAARTAQLLGRLADLEGEYERASLMYAQAAAAYRRGRPGSALDEAQALDDLAAALLALGRDAAADSAATRAARLRKPR